jgi:hypothetical protein
MEIFVESFLVAACGAGLTGFGCRLARNHHLRPGWHLVLLGTGVTSLIVMLLVGQADLFYPQRWDDYKGGFWPYVLFPSTAAAVVALMSSSAVVLYFRGKWTHVKPPA